MITGLKGVDGSIHLKGTIVVKIEVELVKVHWWSRKAVVRVADSKIPLAVGQPCFYHLTLDTSADG